MPVNSTKTVTRPESPWNHQKDLPIVGSRPSGSASAGEVVLAYLRLHAHELRSLEPAVRADDSRLRRCRFHRLPLLIQASRYGNQPRHFC